MDRITGSARSTLGEPAFTEAFERGARLSIEEAAAGQAFFATHHT